MQIHQIQSKTKRKTRKRIARGGARGTTAGRGTKGQKSRAGHSIRPEIRDRIKKIPKKRGYKFASIQIPAKTVNFSAINRSFVDGDQVSPKILLEKGLISRDSGRMPVVKILANGDLTVKNLKFSHCLFSKTALEKITKTGAKVSA